MADKRQWTMEQVRAARELLEQEILTALQTFEDVHSVKVDSINFAYREWDARPSAVRIYKVMVDVQLPR